MWQEFQTILSSEFSDLAQFDDAFRVFIRLVVAGVLGGLLGYEREKKSKDAGIRTHMLVAVGSALFIIGPIFSGTTINDMSRVIQGIIQGIGFLGAGAIIMGTSTTRTKGLTTAASIWATAGVGMIAGLGMEATAILSTLILLVILGFLPTSLLKTKRKKIKDSQ